MSRRFDGGPAFPRAGYYPDTNDVRGDALRERLPTLTEPQDGMNLREHYAGQMLAALIAGRWVALPNMEGWEKSIKRNAELAVQLADELLAALHPPRPVIADEDVD